MRFYADLHIHSKYSRATSRDCDLEHLSYWGRKKGITVIGTGDFTHPAWIQEIKEKLVPAEPGLYRLKSDIEKKVAEMLPPSCHGETRFMLSVEISTIYKKGDKTRKIHHLVYAPTIEKAEKINRDLEKIGNIRSDGRPILGLDSRHLLEIVLRAGEDCFLVPAHIWTPWFAVLGSKSGFDSIAECYGDLANHVFAVETGLSSDPEMNWKISHLDRYCLMSNSDAHSPGKLGREANLFETDLDYYALRKALETQTGFGGTVEFFPEEGKYHMDGHRKCAVRFSPEESKAHHGLCPVCRKPLTLGVLYRVEELADRRKAEKPEHAAGFKSLVPLPEMLSEIADSGAASQKVVRDYEQLLSKLGPELGILGEIPLQEIQRKSSSLFAEGVRRMRAGEVIRDAGYDGEYGVIRLFKKEELKNSTGALFNLESVHPRLEPSGMTRTKKEPLKKKVDLETGTSKIQGSKKEKLSSSDTASDLLAGLDDEQRKAAQIIDGPLLIIAGPGSGKTSTLTRRIAYLIRNKKASPSECLTVTFTRRACEEMRERLCRLLPENGKNIPIMTFHGLAWQILNGHRNAIGLARGFRIANQEELEKILQNKLGWPSRKAGKILRELSVVKRQAYNLKISSSLSDQLLPSPHAPHRGKETKEENDISADVQTAFKVLEKEKDINGLLHYDDLILLAVKMFEEDRGAALLYQKRYPFISVDEYQDIDELQYRLIKQLAPESGNLCVIGDPDQAIYSFRGSDVKFFLRFEEDFPSVQKIRLLKNYRSGSSLVEAAAQMISPSTLVLDRNMEALTEEPGRIIIHTAATEKAEAEFVVHTIEKLLGGLSFFSLDTQRAEGHGGADYSFSDFAVLYRTEKQAAPLEEALNRAGIPFQRRSHRPLCENPLVVSFLDVSALEERRGKVLPSLERFLKAARPEASGETEDSLVRQIRELAEEFNENWEGFISELNLRMEMDAWDDRAERVSLLTLHAAKGLEFRAVFIVGCEDGILPLTWGAECGPENLAEERRLFFVGMTRAKECLFLTHASKRFWNQKIRETAPSPFLKDIEERLLEKLSHPAKKKNPAAPELQLDLF